MIAVDALPKSRLFALLDHFGAVENPRDGRRIQHPLPEVLLLVVCGTIADPDDDEDIAAWGAAHHPVAEDGSRTALDLTRMEPSVIGGRRGNWAGVGAEVR